MMKLRGIKERIRKSDKLNEGNVGGLLYQLRSGESGAELRTSGGFAYFGHKSERAER